MKWALLHYKNMMGVVHRSISPVLVGSPSPDCHISFVAMEKMVTGFLPSTCLMTGSCPTRPSSCTRLIAVKRQSKDEGHLSIISHKSQCIQWLTDTHISQDQTCICSPVPDELFKHLSGQNNNSQPVIILMNKHEHFCMLFVYLCRGISQHLLYSVDEAKMFSDRSFTL